MLSTSTNATRTFFASPPWLRLHFVSVWLALFALLATPRFLWGQCTGCTSTVSTNTNVTANGSQVVCISGVASFTSSITINGNGVVCVASGVSFNPSSITMANTSSLNLYGTVPSGANFNVSNGTITNYGTFSGNLGMNSTGPTVINASGGTFSPGSVNWNNGTITNNSGGSMTFASSFNINSGCALINNGTLTVNSAITVNSGGAATFGGSTTINNSFTNNGTVQLGGNITITGNYTQNSGATTSGVSSASCNYLNVAGTISGNGTYDGTNGLLLNKATSSPACPSCLTNGASSSPPGAPASAYANPTLVASGNNITSTATNPGGSPAATHYIVMRKIGSAPTDVPVDYTTYTAGQVVGTSTVVAVNPVATTTWTDAGVLAAGCQTYYYRIYSQNASGACGAFKTGSYGSASYTQASAGGSISPASATINCGSNSGLLTLSGYTGSILRWESSANAAFSSPATIANTTATYTSGALAANTWYRAVVNAGTGCSNANSASAAITVNMATAASFAPTNVVAGSTTVVTGTNLDLITAVSITGVNAPTFSVNGAKTQLTITVPNCTGSGNIVLTHACGTITLTGVTTSTPGSPPAAGNGVWNAYLYNAQSYTASYVGYYTTPAALGYNTTTNFANNAAPNTATGYLGCPVSAYTSYGLRFIRTNIPAGTYTFGLTVNDDQMDLLINGVAVYSAAAYNNTVRTNAWVGTIAPTDIVEVRYINTGGVGEINWTLAIVASPTAATPGSIGGNQNTCATVAPLSPTLTSVSAPVQGTCTLLATPIQWQSSTDNITFTDIAGANAATYTIPGLLSQTTYYRRKYSSYCEVVYSNTVTVTVTSAPTAGVAGNGVWNAYAYNAQSYTTNYVGSYATPAALGYNTATSFANNTAPSTAPGYAGCPVSVYTSYGLRFIRTNIPTGTYSFGLTVNDDQMDLLINGVAVYSVAGYNNSVRTNAWVGTINASDIVEVRYINTGGNGEINWNLAAITPTASTPGTISGTQNACASLAPATPTLGNVAAPVQGSCTLLATPIQWQSSTDNVTFADIAGANATTYTIPGTLAATTYYRRKYSTYCETVYSNTVTITVSAAPTVGIAGNGVWNAYVYNATDFTSNYSGRYQTSAAVNYNTTMDFTTTSAPSLAASYLGCPVSATSYSVRYIRTNIATGVYQIDLTSNDDDFYLVINGTQFYTRGTNGGATTNIWTGTINASDVVEMRYRNVGGAGYLGFNFTAVTPTASTPGVIAGNQNTCASVAPTSPTLTSTTNPVQGSCTLLPTSIQWQSSTDNLTFTDISGANATTYTIPGTLAVTTYYRRKYSTYCETVYSNTVTVTVSAAPTVGVAGNGVWNAYGYDNPDYTTAYKGGYTTAASLSYSTNTDYGDNTSPSLAPGYLGCPIAQSSYSLRYIRTNMPFGVYRMSVPRLDDEISIIINGVSYAYAPYTGGTGPSPFWTGTIRPSDVVEIRYANTGSGPGYAQWTLATYSPVTASTPGVIAGNQNTCAGTAPSSPTLTNTTSPVQGSCTILPTTGIQWQSSTDNVTFANIAAANALTYTIPGTLAQTTYYRRKYATYCDTAYSNTVTVTVSAAPSVGVAGNGVWNAYGYDNPDYATNYKGGYTTAAALGYSTNTDYGDNTAPSAAPGYQGCPIAQSTYSMRYLRTNIPTGTYRIDVPRLDDEISVIINGVSVAYAPYAGGAGPTNFWTGNISSSDIVEIRYANTGSGPGYVQWNMYAVSPVTPASPGVIGGNQNTCVGTAPSAPTLTNVTTPTIGTCTLKPTPIQWQSSTDNVTFADIAGANATTYIIPGTLAQTTYYRRKYSSYCEVTYSNTVTVTVSAAPTAGVAGNGLWNAYVYNATDFTTNYSGSYQTPAALGYASTTDYTAASAPSTAPSYLGCPVSATSYSVRYIRTGIPFGVYRFDLNRNDDDFYLIINGVQLYTRGVSGALATNIWTGTIRATDVVELRYRNTGGPGDVQWTMATMSPTAATPGAISGNQSRCGAGNPATPTLGNTTSPVQGSCTLLPTPIQWQSSTDNITFANIAGANALTYTIPGSLSQTTYYRRQYRTYCDTVNTNVVTVTITPTPTPSAGPAITYSCAGSATITLTGATATGTFSALTWTGAGGTIAGSGVDPSTYTFTPGSVSGSTTLTLTLTGSGACTGTNPTSTRTINWSSPLAAPTAGPASRCNAGTVTITATPPAGNVVDWYDAATGGTLLLSASNSYTTPSLSTTTTYYAQSRNTTSGCQSNTRTAVTATVNNVLVPFASDNARCGSGTVILTATPYGANEVIDWYAAATGGTALLSASNNYTTPSLTVNTIYYAEARNTINGCVSTTRKAVTAKITPQASITAGTSGTYCPGYNLTLTSSGSTTATSNVYWSGPNFVFNPNPNLALGPVTAAMAGTYEVVQSNFSEANILVNGDFEAGNSGFTSSYTYSPTTYYPEGIYDVGTNPNAHHSSFSACADHTKGDGTGMMMICNGSPVDDATIWQQTVTVDPGMEYQFSYWETSIHPTSPSQVQLSVNGVLLGYVYTVSSTTCAWQQFFYNWTAGPGVTTAVLRMTNQNLAPSGNDFAFDDLNFQQVCADRKFITVNVSAPSTATAVDNARCGPGTVTIGATVPSGIQVDWYAAATGGSPLLSNSATYTTPSLTSTTVYYAEARNPYGSCLSPSRTPVTATINTVPAVPTAGNAARCGTGTVTISATPGAGETIDWYAAATGGSAIATGSTSYTTGNISSSATYYAEARNSTTGCISATRTAVTATVNTVPNAPSATGAGRCGTGTATVSATPASGETIDWYAAASGGSALANGATSYSPSVSGTTTFYAESRNTTTGCVSASRTAATITVTPAPSATIAYSAASYCISAGGSQSVTQTGTTGGTYSASPAGLSLNTSTGAINVATSSAGSYTVTYTIAASGFCSTYTTTASVAINADVTTPSVSGPASLCQGTTGTAYTGTVSNASSMAWSVTGAGNTITGSSTTGTLGLGASFTGTATVTLTAQGCGGPKTGNTSVTVNPTGTWLGITNSWTTASNWCGSIPTTTTDVIIPSGVPNFPLVDGTSYARNLTIAAGASVTALSGQTLDVSGTLTPTGSIMFNAGSTVNYSGGTAQAIPALDYANLSTSGAGAKSFSTTGTTRISGTFTPGGSGAFNTAGTTIEFNGTSAQTIPGFSFGSLTTSGNSAKTMSGNVTVAGALALTNGTLGIGANTLSLNGTIASGGTGTLSSACASSIVLGGSGAKGTLKFTPGNNSIGNLTMAESAAGSVDLGSDVNICTQLTLTQGLINLGSNNLTLLSGAATTNGNNGSYMVTLDQKATAGAGTFIQEVPNGGTRTFPVGTSTSYTPAYLTGTGTLRNYSVRAFNSVYDHGTSGGTVSNISAAVQRSWEILPLAGAGVAGAQIGLEWQTSDEGAAFTAARNTSYAYPYVGRNTGGASGVWSPQVTSSEQLATSAYRITTASQVVFGTYAIGSLETELPVRMGPLTLSQSGKQNVLAWMTYSEADADRFEVQRSQDGVAFKALGNVAAAGTSNVRRTYGYADDAQPGRAYYRIRYIGRNPGDEAYSNTVATTGKALAILLKGNPNPTFDRVTLQGLAPTTTTLDARLTDGQGKTHSVPVTLEDGAPTLSLSHLPAGLYMVEVLADGAPVGYLRVVRK